MSKNLNKEAVVCSCSQVTVGEILTFKEETPDFKNMSFDTKLEELDIGQTCEGCLEEDGDRHEVFYKEIL